MVRSIPGGVEIIVPADHLSDVMDSTFEAYDERVTASWWEQGLQRLN
jgi:hypothetical protein